MKANPFAKYLTKEDHLQIQISNWLKYQYPDLIWIHPPNEGKRTPFEQYLFKQLGALSGASDMIFFRATKKYHGLVLELKVRYEKGGKNYPSENQKRFLEALKNEGWYTCVVWDFDEAVNIINDYMKERL